MQCRVCDSRKEHKKFKIREMLYGLREEFSYFQCEDCGCLQIENIPENLSDYYPKDYYSFGAEKGHYNPFTYIISRVRTRYAVFNKGCLGKYLYSRYPYIALRSLSRVKINRRSRILDVGCGSGNMLFSLAKYGFKSILGVDPYIEKDISYGMGFKVIKNQLHELNGQFDVIMFHHSFEHIDSPLKTLQAAKKLLAPNGTCVIRIPIVDSWAWEHYGKDWVAIDAPRHLFLHSRKSMELLARQTGLKIVNIVCDSTDFQFWASEQYKNDIPLKADNSHWVNPAKSTFTKEQIADFKKKAEVLNSQQKGDQAAFYLSHSELK